jgi:hypothetical protein
MIDDVALYGTEPVNDSIIIWRNTGALPSKPGRGSGLPPANVPCAEAMPDAVFVTYVWLAAVPINTGDSDPELRPANKLIRTDAGPIPNAAVDPVPKIDATPPLIWGLLIWIGVVELLAKMILP